MVLKGLYCRCFTVTVVTVHRPIPLWYCLYYLDHVGCWRIQGMNRRVCRRLESLCINRLIPKYNLCIEQRVAPQVVHRVFRTKEERHLGYIRDCLLQLSNYIISASFHI